MPVGSGIRNCESLLYKQWVKSHYRNLVNVDQEGEDRLCFANAMVCAEKYYRNLDE
jgi:hypothetical protein